GAEYVIDGREDGPSKVKETNEGRLADLVVTCTGAAKAIAQGFASVDRGGTILLFAPTEPAAKIVIPFNALWREEVTVISSYGGSPRDVRDAIELLAGKRISVGDLITHVLPLASAKEGFQLVARARDSIKVILRPSGSRPLPQTSPGGNLRN